MASMRLNITALVLVSLMSLHKQDCMTTVASSQSATCTHEAGYSVGDVICSFVYVIHMHRVTSRARSVGSA